MANSISEIVPAGTLLNIAKRVRQKAFEIAKTKNVPMRSLGEIVIDSPRITQAQISVNLRLSNSRIAAFEWGSGIHATRGTKGKYPITPKTARALAFPGTNAWEGQTIVTKLVKHPGVKAKPFLAPAKRQTRKQNLEELRRVVTGNIRLQIRTMAKKI